MYKLQKYSPPKKGTKNFILIKEKKKEISLTYSRQNKEGPKIGLPKRVLLSKRMFYKTFSKNVTDVRRLKMCYLSEIISRVSY